MADVAVEFPPSALPFKTKAVPSDAIPDIDSLEGAGNEDEDEYSMLKRYQRHLEYVEPP
jgi:26S proteasome regulatory subunit T3